MKVRDGGGTWEWREIVTDWICRLYSRLCMEDCDDVKTEKFSKCCLVVAVVA